MTVMNQKLDELWSKYDKDGSDFIEKSEGKKLLLELVGQKKIDEADGYEAAFDGLDQSDDGRLSKAEIGKFIKWLCEPEGN